MVHSTLSSTIVARGSSYPFAELGPRKPPLPQAGFISHFLKFGTLDRPPTYASKDPTVQVLAAAIPLHSLRTTIACPIILTAALRDNLPTSTFLRTHKGKLKSP
jgi:hypothetical protein